VTFFQAALPFNSAALKDHYLSSQVDEGKYQRASYEKNSSLNGRRAAF